MVKTIIISIILTLMIILLGIPLLMFYFFSKEYSLEKLKKVFLTYYQNIIK